MNKAISVANDAELYCYLPIIAMLLLSIYVYDLFTKPTTIPKIFEIPHYPVVGNLLQLRNNPAQTLLEWSLVYEQQIYQIRLGNKRVIVVNSFDYVAQLWNKNSCSNNSRPMTYTFHNIVSSTQVFTIGSTPSIPSCTKAKKALAMNLNSKSLVENNILAMINSESKLMIRQLFSKNRELSGPPSVNLYRHKSCALADIDMMDYCQLYVLKISLLISFGYPLKQEALAREIITVESMIMKFRSPLGNLADYLPALRIWRQSKPNLVRQRRDVYMNNLFNNIHSDSIIGKLQLQNKLNQLEIRSIALSLISAGLDNTPLNFNHLMGHLSQPYGQNLQHNVFKLLIKSAGDKIQQAWDDSLNMDCELILAMIYETLRFFTVLPLSLPRVTTKPIEFYPQTGPPITIPNNTILFMNAYAANHDASKFKSPYEFNPQRWLTVNNRISTEVSHFAFGAGSRKCSGNNLAIQQLYTLTCRMILMFKILPPVSDTLMELDPFKNNLHPSAISFEPKLFKVKLVPRLYPGIDDLYNKIIKD